MAGLEHASIYASRSSPRPWRLCQLPAACQTLHVGWTCILSPHPPPVYISSNTPQIHDVCTDRHRHTCTCTYQKRTHRHRHAHAHTPPTSNTHIHTTYIDAHRLLLLFMLLFLVFVWLFAKLPLLPEHCAWSCVINAHFFILQWNDTWSCLATSLQWQMMLCQPTVKPTFGLCIKPALRPLQQVTAWSCQTKRCFVKLPSSQPVILCNRRCFVSCCHTNTWSLAATASWSIYKKNLKQEWLQAF